MLGVLYLILCFTTGYAFCSAMFPNMAASMKKSYAGQNIQLCPLFLQVPVWFLCGALPMTWATYFLGYAFQKSEQPLLWANCIVLTVACFVSVIVIFLRLRKKNLGIGEAFAKVTLKESIFIVLVAALVIFLMWWSFFVRNGKLYVGFSIFSDFAPHLGMIRSFSYGNNFPTQYSHFAGEDIKYHFLFQFMVGNLEYLGMRIDFAFNVPSAICLMGAFFLLYTLAVRLSGKRFVGYIACLLFAFRSSDAFFDYLASLPKDTDIIKALRDNMEFIGTTANENWGLWNLNVYCNQRHLAIGLCVLLFLVIMLMPYVFEAGTRIKRCMAEAEENMTEKDPNYVVLLPERYGVAVKQSLFAPDGWLPRSLRETLGLALLLGMCCFFNGACVIACLAVLFVMAIISDRRLEYAIVALVTTILTLLATRFFMEGAAVSPKYYFGFLAANKTLFGALDYIMTLCGVLPIVLVGGFLLARGVKKWIVFAFSAPFILAFTLSLTVDITVNHKYIMISIMLLCIPAAAFVEWLWHRYGVWPRLVSLVLVFMLTITGIYDLSVVMKKNDASKGYCMVFDQEDPVTLWIRDNATSQDIFLSSYYSLSNVVLGGAMLYYGWPYYAWSAGYDTFTRDENVRIMYESNTPEELKALMEEHSIRYIIVDDEVRNSGEYVVNEENIQNTYECVFTHGNLNIYDTKLQR